MSIFRVTVRDLKIQNIILYRVFKIDNTTAVKVVVIGIKVEIVLVVRNIQNRFIQIVEEKVNNVENVINTTNSFERFRVKIFSYNNKEPRIVFSRVREKKLRL